MIAMLKNLSVRKIRAIVGLNIRLTSSVGYNKYKTESKTDALTITSQVCGSYSTIMFVIGMFRMADVPVLVGRSVFGRKFIIPEFRYGTSDFGFELL